VCDCIWKEWGGWGQCSKTCDEGTKTRERTVVRQATNGGQACEEDINGSEQDSCLIIHCPIDCTWSEWTIWSDCSDKCSDGINTRTRQIESPAMHNGTCEGTNQEARPCNNMKALEQVIANLQNNNTELQEENRKLKEKLNAMESKDTKSLILKDPHLYRNNLFKTLDTWGPNFNIKFDIVLNKNPDWSSVIHLTTYNGNCWKHKGCRLPGVWLTTRNSKPNFFFASSMAGKHDFIFVPIKLNQYYTIELSHKDAKFIVTMNSKVVWNISSGVSTFNDVKFWLSNPWYRSAQDFARITNLRVNGN